MACMKTEQCRRAEEIDSKLAWRYVFTFVITKKWKGRSGT